MALQTHKGLRLEVKGAAEADVAAHAADMVWKVRAYSQHPLLIHQLQLVDREFQSLSELVHLVGGEDGLGIGSLQLVLPRPAA